MSSSTSYPVRSESKKKRMVLYTKAAASSSRATLRPRCNYFRQQADMNLRRLHASMSKENGTNSLLRLPTHAEILERAKKAGAAQENEGSDDDGPRRISEDEASPQSQDLDSEGGRRDADIALSRSTRATPKKSELESLAGASINASSSKGQEKQGTRSALAMVKRAKTLDRSEPREVVEPTKGTAEYWIWKSPLEAAMNGDPQGHARSQIGIMLRKEIPPEQRRKLNAHIELLNIARHSHLDSGNTKSTRRSWSRLI